ncbi:rfaE bifunctional protein, domain I/rfaE bifunctional protein, domain II [Streptoalloteichus tenebrarius]|uniref:D-glycero-beta-D-manno-heptose 1-phosphate adenylyltransferase n=1 Tax=Streptoalloteichus tenebrarius (strain ATCC 17920 / DSM 40477 / JCM 4838 / CBS 697.72 / NBRC 16177 / NCIMB 11028 / NRRL B-12390 / A12253. 1 / ISP 5477) TaxID=1933 RepID=A0ABT1I223_STRSD|nr:D-glycero-beta-D-manno-heptose 1-phosphate adenylyltransferase [Streptoalloteichus tenebrarius]MCP2261831.1 rfaE bifunctional protein, domain I/rfaE bifunctional protein, domain II [Streptoalloteichus tenebrarius]BFE99976.1 PfkB family carbohydrate kinase [Streptoalloteichus tenebrarius]
MTGPLVVVGDALLDVDVVGSVTRVCPDAPAPVLDVRRERARPGGAGLAAALAAADGVPVVLVTALADDEAGQRLESLLRDRVRLVAGRAAGPTPVKTRLRCDGHSLARIDRGDRQASVRPSFSVPMLSAVREAGAVLVADYGRGVAEDPALRALLADLAARIPVVWDPHPRGATPVPGVRLATPNLAEARQFSGERGGEGAELAIAERCAASLRRQWRARAVAVTMGARGALLDQGGPGPVAAPAQKVSVADPCGAGDRFAATAARWLREGAPTDEAVAAAVTSAGEFLAAGGVDAMDDGNHRGMPPVDDGMAEAERVVAATRARGGVVVATGGCFDLLHAGHTRTLAAARALGDCLVVCLNSDASVRRLKGAARPIIDQRDRAELLRALSTVDAVVVFDEDTPEATLARLRPDVWVKGGDYSADRLPEAELVRSWGGQAVVVPYHRGRSTTGLVRALSR